MQRFCSCSNVGGVVLYVRLVVNVYCSPVLLSSTVVSAPSSVILQVAVSNSTTVSGVACALAVVLLVGFSLSFSH